MFSSVRYVPSCLWRGRPKYTITLVCFGAKARPYDATARKIRDESRATAEPFPLDVSFKVLKVEHGGTGSVLRLYEQMLRPHRSALQDQDLREDQRFNESIDHIDKFFMRRDATSVDMKYLRSNRQIEGLPGEQARPEGEDAYSEDFGINGEEAVS